MKRKIVLWGHDENDKKILIALELVAKENKVNIYTFEEQLATELFYNLMMDDWRLGKEVNFPEGFKTVERPLSATEDLLPENIKVHRTDLISRAKAEWHFAVLSSKLYELYGTELEDLKEKINALKEYDNKAWDEMKAFWSKVQKQIFEKNLFREHADKLSEQTNALFSRLKELRTKANAELEKVSKEKFDVFSARLDEIGEKVEKGLGLNPIFEELKKIQNEFKDTEFTRQDRSKLWKRIDESFKKVKEKKYGKPQSSGGGVSRIERRYQGLLSAIDKMERSIARDQKDINFQSKKVDETDGQLEMQIRQAKIKMIEERINSKKDKLNEMLATRTDLEARMEKEKARAEKVLEKKELEKVKKEMKEKIASEIKEKTESLSEEEKRLREAADAINEIPGKKKDLKKDTMLGAISTTLGEAIGDVVDTVKAVGEVVGDKVEEKIDEIKEKVEFDEKVEKVKEAVDEVKEKIDMDAKVEKVKEAVEEVKEKVTEQVEHIADKIIPDDPGNETSDEVVSDSEEE
ncbi:MAG: hypothetical protein KJO50_04910 [Bacteroidia bacterium]|nr:hypothetical protein [Bacteroidia bacterium]